MNKSFIFIFFLIAGVSCSQPDDKGDIELIYQSLAEQKHFYYNVNYSICNSTGSTMKDFHGLVSLNRNTSSGISSAYFGPYRDQKPHYLQSIYLSSEWIYNLQSQRYRLEDADVIIDSLHSPILLNPDLLLQIQENSLKISHQTIDRNNIKWIFEMKNKPDQLMLHWNTEEEKLIEIEYTYNINSEQSYSRKWQFDYLARSEFNKLENIFKQQNKSAYQVFL